MPPVTKKVLHCAITFADALCQGRAGEEQVRQIGDTQKEYVKPHKKGPFYPRLVKLEERPKISE